MQMYSMHSLLFGVKLPCSSFYAKELSAWWISDSDVTRATQKVADTEHTQFPFLYIINPCI